MKLYNTLGRKIDNVSPLEDNVVKLYTCGLTVYSQPHIGNWVAYIYWDVLERTLQANGFKVKRVQNITDVGHLTSDEDAGEDKMLASALKEGTTAWQVAEKYIDIANHEAYELLGLLKPEYLPRATDYVEQQIKFVKELEEKGYTYTIDDGVYFDTSKLDDYGKLAKLDLQGLRFGARVADTGKKNPTDFALWKFSPKDQKRDMEWESPWGVGFPGWHLECSAIAKELLGDQIDIHTGGIDHIPVHHTNEIAQTEALTGKNFASIWVHANHMKVNGTKMSKSLGNIYTLADVQEKGIDLQAFKLLVLSKHYSTEGNFTWEIAESAQNRLIKWQEAADLQWQSQPSEQTDNDNEILEALSNNLDTPAALSAIDSRLSEVRQQGSSTNAAALKKLLANIKDYLGIDLMKPDISSEQKDLIKKRESAKEKRDFAVADSIRQSLKQQGVGLEDRPENHTTWYWL